MKAQLADGRILEFPDGTDPEIIKSTVKKLTATDTPAPEEYPESKIPMIQASREGGFMKGMRDPVMGTSQLLEKVGATQKPSEFLSAEQQIAAQNIDMPTQTDVIRREEDIYQAGRKERGEEGFDFARMGGNLLSPATIGLMAVPGGQATLPARMAAGSGSGLVGATTQPALSDDFASEKLNQAVWGVALGGLIPAGITATGKVGGFIDEFGRPFTEKGIKKDVAQFMRTLAGEEREQVIAALSRAEGDETAQQVLGKIFRESIESGDPKAIGMRLAGFEDELAKSKYTGGAIQSTKAGQEKARLDVASELAGEGTDVAQDLGLTGTKLEVAKQTRELASDKNYGEAFDPNIKIQGDNEISDILKDPFLMDAMPAANKLAKAEGITIDSHPTQFLHFIKLGIDEQLQKTGDSAIKGASKRKATEIQKRLVKWIGDKNPKYELARQENIRLSRPIDQMKVGGELKKGLETAVEIESPGPFLSAVKDAPKTLKKATGFRHNQLDDIFDPSQMADVGKMTQALLNAQKGKQLASGKVGSLGDLRSEIEFSLPNMLSRPVMLANAILKQVGKDKSPEYQRVAEALVLDPNKLAKALELPPENMRKKIAEEIMRKSSIITSSQEAGRGMGAN